MTSKETIMTYEEIRAEVETLIYKGYVDLDVIRDSDFFYNASQESLELLNKVYGQVRDNE